MKVIMKFIILGGGTIVGRALMLKSAASTLFGKLFVCVLVYTYLFPYLLKVIMALIMLVIMTCGLECFVK